MWWHHSQLVWAEGSDEYSGRYPIDYHKKKFLHTLPETNSKFAPENRPYQEEIHLLTINSQVQFVSFREGNLPSQWAFSKKITSDDFRFYHKVEPRKNHGGETELKKGFRTNEATKNASNISTCYIWFLPFLSYPFFTTKVWRSTLHRENGGGPLGMGAP